MANRFIATDITDPIDPTDPTDPVLAGGDTKITLSGCLASSICKSIPNFADFLDSFASFLDSARSCAGVGRLNKLPPPKELADPVLAGAGGTPALTGEYSVDAFPDSI